MSAVLVALGGALGSVLRHLVAVALPRRDDAAWPWSTWLVNALGSTVLGAVAGLVAQSGLAGSRAGHDVLLLVGTGLCGAFTTYATFAHETVTMLDRGRWALASAYVASSVVVGVAGFTTAWWAAGLAVA